MKENKPPSAASGEAALTLSIRPRPEVAERFWRVLARSKRTKSSLLSDCIDAGLPKLEREYGTTEKKAA